MLEFDYVYMIVVIQWTFCLDMGYPWIIHFLNAMLIGPSLPVEKKHVRLNGWSLEYPFFLGGWGFPFFMFSLDFLVHFLGDCPC